MAVVRFPFAEIILQQSVFFSYYSTKFRLNILAIGVHFPGINFKNTKEVLLGNVSRDYKYLCLFHLLSSFVFLMAYAKPRKLASRFLGKCE